MNKQNKYKYKPMSCQLIKSALFKINNKDVSYYMIKIYIKVFYNFLISYIKKHIKDKEIISVYANSCGNIAFYNSHKKIKTIMSISNDAGVPGCYIIIKYQDIDDNIVETYIISKHKDPHIFCFGSR